MRLSRSEVRRTRGDVQKPLVIARYLATPECQRTNSNRDAEKWNPLRSATPQVFAAIRSFPNHRRAPDVARRALSCRCVRSRRYVISYNQLANLIPPGLARDVSGDRQFGQHKPFVEGPDERRVSIGHHEEASLRIKVVNDGGKAALTRVAETIWGVVCEIGGAVNRRVGWIQVNEIAMPGVAKRLIKRRSVESRT